MWYVAAKSVIPKQNGELEAHAPLDIVHRAWQCGGTQLKSQDQSCSDLKSHCSEDAHMYTSQITWHLWNPLDEIEASYIPLTLTISDDCLQLSSTLLLIDTLAYITLTPGQYFHQWSVPLRTLLTFNVQMWFCYNWVAYSAIAEEWRVIAYGAPFAIVVGLHRVYTPLVVSGTFTFGLYPLLYVWLEKKCI